MSIVTAVRVHIYTTKRLALEFRVYKHDVKIVYNYMYEINCAAHL